MLDWSSAQRPLIIGHRGTSAEAPENTLAAFALAQAQGADGIELDVQLSADGWPVVIHDSELERTTSGRGQVQQLTLAQLQELDAGKGQTIPTLDEVFETLGPGFLYNVELKTAALRDTGLAAAVADRIQAHHVENQTIVSSFNPLAVRRARQHLTQSTWVAHLSYTTILKYKYLLAPSQAVHPHYRLVDADYMAWAKKMGWRVHVWTVDDPVEAQRLFDLGVHAIITNQPKLIRNALFSHEKS
jgi:glycerophosphoryl diester phosphodiesterase